MSLRRITNDSHNVLTQLKSQRGSFKNSHKYTPLQLTLTQATHQVCQNIPRATLEQVYHFRLPRPREGEDPDRPPTAHELLSTYGCEELVTGVA